jgi:hypothetical protein
MPSPAMPVKLVSSTDQAYGGLCKRTDFVDVVAHQPGVNFQPVPMLVSEYLGGGTASNPVAWYRKGSGITVTGSGVSQWSDASGNGRHLLQATDAARPALQSDGTILFNGSNHTLKTAAFTLNQPETVYLLMQSVSWTGADCISDGNAANSMALYQDKAGGSGVSPAVTQYAGLYGGEDLTHMTVGVYHVLCAVFNGASSLIQVDANTPGTGDASTTNAGGFTVGRTGDGFGSAANIRVKEIMIFAQAHSATQRALINSYLQTL